MRSSRKDLSRKSAFMLMLITLLALAVGLRGQDRADAPEDLDRQMELVKSDLERRGSSPARERAYNRLSEMMSKCSPMTQLIDNFVVTNDIAPSANLCINGALAVADPDYNRVLMASTGTGIGNGTLGNCSLSGSGTAVNYDEYAFNLTGCAAFPTVVTAQLCGPAGCTAPAAIDTVLTLYRNVAAGDPMTANGGLGGAFNPASACTNARAANDDSGATPTSTGGSTCNQLNTADCLAPCGVSTGLSEFKRSLGSGRFHLVVAGFGNSTTGAYNLYVDAPAAGCALSLAPTAANAMVSGRVVRADGTGISKAVLTLSGGDLGTPITVKTNGLGYYSIPGLPAGQSYVLTVGSKQYSFTDPTRVITLTDSVENIDFTAAP